MIVLMLAGVGTAGAQEVATATEPSSPHADDTVELSAPPKALKRVSPSYPHEGLAVDMPFVECNARIIIDSSGTPTSVVVSDCPNIFSEPVEEALKRWRFEPVMADGHPVAAVFFMSVKFRRGELDVGTYEAFERIVQAYLSLDDPRDLCVVTMTTHPDGSMTELFSNRLPECLIVPTFVRRPGKVQNALDSDVVCTARVSVKAGRAVTAEMSECEEPFAAHVKRSLMSFHYNYVGDAGEYEVRISLAAE